MNVLRMSLAVSLLTTLGVASASAQSDPFLEIPERMREFIADQQIAGAVTLVGHQGKVVHVDAVGMADLDTQRKMTPDTLFGVMSMTKPITATALMTLIHEGKLALDDPVEKYIPAFAEAKTKDGEPVRGLTIRRLLTHTSGLVGDQGCKGSLEATANELAHRPFGFQPGEKWEYGPSLNVCGRLIEIASGMPYDKFLAQLIFQPLGMSDTTFEPTTAQHEQLATLYELDKDAKKLKPAKRLLIPETGAVVPNPSGGLFSTAADMARFYHMILAGGEFEGRRVVPAEIIRPMTTVQTGDLATGFTPGNGWGFGWCVIRQPQGLTGMLSPGTFGHGGAYGTQGWIDPVRRAVFVLMIQRSNLPNSDASEIRSEFQRVAVEALEKQMGT